ncbi:RNA-dependent RNA polymerase [Wenzhou narna-like virus 9]|uniref:RNA-dependent RNA polymerase n=1 Tax=Wenzhou narna-like virus 9 TaxID=1923584 RepID=UPI00090BEF04|nr:RNA-dependent RNA polymerase [Wenzhou narna-like virus 9]APG77289.1 RNA-dependent RNA polymerase [Wenzhou narna-like virus 9]
MLNTETRLRSVSKTDGLQFVEDKLYKELSLQTVWQDTWILAMTSVILDPLVCVPVPVTFGDRTIHIFVKKAFCLTKQEVRALRTNNSTLKFGRRDFCGRMSRILSRRFERGECVKSLCIDPVKGRYVMASRDVEKLRQAWGAALTVYTGLITFLKGEKPVHCATLRNKRGRTVVRKSSTSFPLLSLWTHFLRKLPSVSEKKLVKVIKVSLCGTFALKANQDLPEDFESLGIPLMPTYMLAWVESRCKSFNDYVTLYFCLQQAKGLLTRVPDTFIVEGLQKHRDGICRPEKDTIPKDTEMYERMRNFASSKFGAYVGKIYDPYSTKVPNQTACIGRSRQKGGNLAQLKTEGSFINTSDPFFQSPQGRMEPMVIGLFGAPGSGKTTRLREITAALRQSLFPHCEDADLVYSRSCATQHWDGYRNQPIVVLDDFGQDHNRKDVVEFAQLVSTNQYLLPMAELSEKGASFTSPIIIVTTNLKFGDNLLCNSLTFCEDPGAIWRRFHVPVMVTKFDDGSSGVHAISMEALDSGPPPGGSLMKSLTSRQVRYRNRSVPSQVPSIEAKNHLCSTGVNYELDPEMLSIMDLKELVKKTFQERVAYHRDCCQGKWVQQISSVDIRTVRRDSEVSDTLLYAGEGLSNSGSQVRPGLHSYIQFPLEPPAENPVVEVVALPEPAKVRCITVGEANLKCLKPLQMAMWQSLSQYPEFSLTHGVADGRVDDDKLLIFRRMEDEIRRIHNPHGTWLSGDYTAATDNLPMWVTEALLEGILDHIEHEPTKRWARYEAGRHEVLYPESSCLEPGSQTSGQLMGSLISFPLLCMANSFIVEYSGIEPGSYLVNGDDIVASTSQNSIDKWKENAPRIGLSLSMGKNFISDEFCTVNSQLFLKDTEGVMSIRHTGKTGLLHRGEGEPLGRTFSDFQNFYGLEDIYRQTYIRHNLESLRRTPQSLQVPISHGGLASTFTYGVTLNQKLAKEVWVASLLERITKSSDEQFHTLTGYCPLRVPYLCFEEEEEIPNQQAESVISAVKGLFLPEEDIDINGDEKVYDLTHRRLARVREDLKKENSYLSPLRFISQMSELKIQDLPSLDSVKFKTHFVRKSDYTTLRHKYLGDFARELSCYIKGRPRMRDSTDVELSLPVYVEALTAKTTRALSRLSEEREVSMDKLSQDDSETDIFLTSMVDAILADSLESLLGDQTPVCNSEYFCSYDSAIRGHANEEGSKGIPELVRPVENPWCQENSWWCNTTLSENPWGEVDASPTHT